MSAASPFPGTIRFGAFEVDLRAGELRKFGIKIRLQDKPFQILVLLLEHPGELVTREQMRQRLWPGDTFVDFDRSLNTAVKKVRRALGDSADCPCYVETQARRGYRFIAPVEVLEEKPPAAVPLKVLPLDHAPRKASRWLPAAILCMALAVTPGVLWLSRMNRGGGAAQPGLNSIAVLPLANLSADPEQEYFADGLTDALISELARIGALRVISRTSVMRYKNARTPVPEIGRALHAGAIVEGTVQRAGAHLRVTAQLIETATDRHLWAETYDRNVADLLALQKEIAATVARQIQVRVTPREQEQLAHSPALDPEAYEAYMRGRFLWNRRSAESLQKALPYFEQAIARQPGWPLAYVGLADCYNLLSYYGASRPNHSFPKAKAAAERALQLDPELAEAHAALGFARLHYDWDWAGAEAEFQRALSLNPGYANAHHWYSHYLLATGDVQASIGEISTALALDPLNLGINNHLAHAYILTGRFDDAIRQLLKTLEIEPASARAHSLLGEAYEGKGLFPEALAEYRRAIAISPEDPQPRAGLAHTYAASGRRAEAEQEVTAIEELHRRRGIGAYHLAVTHAALRNPNEAFAWLEQARAARSEEMFYLKIDPLLAPLRPDPRFTALLRQIGLSR